MLSAGPAYSLHTRVQVAERLLIAGLRAHERIDESEAARARLVFLFRASQELALSLERSTVLQTAVDLVVPDLADGATLYTCAADGRTLPATSATSDAIADRTQEWWNWFEGVSRQAVRRAIRSGTSQHAIAALKHARNTPFTEPRVSYLVVPIHARGQRLGALRLLSLATRRPYGRDDVDLAEAFSSQASLALQNASLYEKQLALVAHLEEVRGQLDAEQTERLRDDERRRIAHDLHDHVEQTFFAIGLTATAALDHRHHEASSKELTEALRHVNQLSTSGAEQLRSAIFALKHSHFPTFRLVSSLRGVVREFQRRTGVEADLVVAGTESAMPDEVTRTLHAVVREALANVERHANATSVVVKLHLQSRSVTLTIVDDGTGAPTLVLERLGLSALHFGLAGLNERVRQLRGSFKAGPSASGGFVVRTRLPLPEEVTSP